VKVVGVDESLAVKFAVPIANAKEKGLKLGIKVYNANRNSKVHLDRVKSTWAFVYEDIKLLSNDE
jgi:hypothetical protein